MRTANCWDSRRRETYRIIEPLDIRCRFDLLSEGCARQIGSMKIFNAQSMIGSLRSSEELIHIKQGK